MLVSLILLVSLNGLSAARSKYVGVEKVTPSRKPTAYNLPHYFSTSPHLNEELCMESTAADGKCSASRLELCLLTGGFESECGDLASPDEVHRYLTELAGFIQTSPLKLKLIGMMQMPEWMFSPMRKNIIVLNISEHNGFNTDKLQHLKLSNLLELEFSVCYGIEVTRSGLMGFTQLRSLVFRQSIIFSFERQTLESLVSLKALILDNGISPSKGLRHEEHLRRFHCDIRYHWFREYLDDHPGLIQPKNRGELYSGSSSLGHESQYWGRRDIFYPVHCRRPGMTQDNPESSATFAV